MLLRRHLQSCGCRLFRGKAFGARAYADNFTNEEIKDIIVMAHLHGVKVYVTINTLVYDHEFAQLIDFWISYIFMIVMPSSFKI